LSLGVRSPGLKQLLARGDRVAGTVRKMDANDQEEVERPQPEAVLFARSFFSHVAWTRSNFTEAGEGVEPPGERAQDCGRPPGLAAPSRRRRDNGSPRQIELRRPDCGEGRVERRCPPGGDDADPANRGSGEPLLLVPAELL